MKPFIIADVGSNHRNSLDIAYAQIEAAKSCGCDAVKFQLFTHAELYGLPGKLEYELPIHWLPELKACADKNGIEFMCSAFSPEGVATVNPFVTRHKLASAEMKHVQMLDVIKATRKPWIVSTGGATKPEMDWLIGNHDNGLMTILECVALYPAPASTYNLSSLEHYRSYDIPVGVSDHTMDVMVAVTSVGFGATVFEKHFDCKLDAHGPTFAETPDSPVSVGMYGNGMKLYVASIRMAFSAIGDGEKTNAHQHEMASRWRRRLIATRDLEIGDKLEMGINYGIYRSLIDDTRAAPPEAWEYFNGKIVTTPVKQGTGIWKTDIECA